MKIGLRVIKMILKLVIIKMGYLLEKLRLRLLMVEHKLPILKERKITRMANY